MNCLPPFIHLFVEVCLSLGVPKCKLDILMTRLMQRLLFSFLISWFFSQSEDTKANKLPVNFAVRFF